MDEYAEELMGSGTMLGCSLDNTTLTWISCEMTDMIFQVRAISIAKIITASLSIIASLSVIGAIIVRQKAWNSEAHPLLMLCIADFLLAGLFLVGGCLHLHRDGKGYLYKGCFLVSTFTLSLECVTAALTVVYAAFAYAHVKQMCRHLLQPQAQQETKKAAISPCVAIIIYLLAWIIPVVAVVTPVRIIGTLDNTFEDMESCSCRCIPTFGNILPLAKPGAVDYYRKISKIVAVEGGIVATTFIVAFILVVIFYVKTFMQIRRTAEAYEMNYNGISSAKHAAMLRRQIKQARTRIIAYLSVFSVIGFVTGIFAYGVMLYHTINLTKGNDNHTYYYQTYLIQALIIPTQGLLNAIIYGWTRKAFLRATVRKPSRVVQAGVGLEESAHNRQGYSTFETNQDNGELTRTTFVASETQY